MNAAPGGHGVTADDVRGYIWPSGVGPRVAEPALMPINPYPWSGAMLHEGRLDGKRDSRLALPAAGGGGDAPACPQADRASSRAPSLISAAPDGSLELPERAILCLDTEVAGVQHLDASLVITVEGRRGVRASGGHGVGRVTEPHPEMVHVHRRGCGIRRRIDAGVRLGRVPARRGE